MLDPLDLGGMFRPGRRPLRSHRVQLLHLWITLILAVSTACHSSEPVRTPGASPDSQRQIANLHAFARLYGVVRWFHPSDAAASIDWDRFAIDGVHRVIDARDTRALRAVLTELFAPIAPTVHLAGPGEPFPDEPALHPASTSGLEIVAWEHEGYGDSIATSAYASKRRHRDRLAAVRGLPYGAVWQTVDATALRGHRIRLRGQVRTANGTHAQLWIRVERGDATGFNDDMEKHPVSNAVWAPAEVSGIVDADATRVVIGVQSMGPGTVWYDDLELHVQGANGTWKAIKIQDPGFEAEPLLANWSPGTGHGRATSFQGWNVTLDHDRPASGSASLRIEPVTEVTSSELFDEAPEPGETVDIDLGTGLRARVPLALYSKDGHTLGDDVASARRSQTQPKSQPIGFDAVAGTADIVVAWNVLQHFWPYWNLVSVDWNAELDAALRDALDDRSVEDHAVTIRHLSAAAPDAHMRTTCAGEGPKATPPFRVAVVEGQVVIIESADPALKRGDVIVAVDGRSAAEAFAAAAALRSGSPHWKFVGGSWDFALGPAGSTLRVRVRRGQVQHDIAVTRGDRPPKQHAHPSIERLDDGVYYVDLGRASMADIDAVMDRLAAAPGVVFDLRDYPNSNHQVLSHLLTRPDDSTAWMAVPHVIRPDHAPGAVVGWHTHGWQMPVLQPHIAGRVAFLTGPGAASYAESVMGLVKHYRLGEIVGSATAGTNGNIGVIAMPTGCHLRFTGMRVTKHDGTQHHLVGVQPTIRASQTIAGVAAGRDEVLEKALVYVRGGVSRPAP